MIQKSSTFIILGLILILTSFLPKPFEIYCQLVVAFLFLFVGIRIYVVTPFLEKGIKATLPAIAYILAGLFIVLFISWLIKHIVSVH